MRSKIFTLLELLIVIAIMALLISILFPALAKVKAKAAQISCISNLKSVGLAHVNYMNDYDSYLVMTYNFRSPSRHWFFTSYLGQYLMPSFNDIYWPDVKAYPMIHCPALRTTSSVTVPTSFIYGCNISVCGYYNDAAANDGPFKAQALGSPTEKIIGGDASGPDHNAIMHKNASHLGNADRFVHDKQANHLFLDIHVSGSNVTEVLSMQARNYFQHP